MIKQYKEYVDSGFEWVGLVPKDWRQTQLKYITSISKGKKAKEDFQDFLEGMLPYLSMEYLRNQTESPSFVYADDPNIVLVDEQDLLILWDGSKAGEIVKAKKGALSSTMGKIHVESELFDLNYLTYYLKNAERYIQANTVGMGIPHVSGEVLRTLFITFPSKDIQTKIAQYLDYQTAIIDQLIQQKEKLIELLKEKRQSVINEAVTKGLNTNAPMKDSGIEWLGEVPEHWSVLALNKIIEVKDGTHDTPNYVDQSEPGCYPLITSKDFNNGEIDFTNAKYISEADHLEIIKRSNTEKGDILMSMIGGNIGNMVYVNVDTQFSIKNVALFKTASNPVLGKFLFYILKSNLLQVQIDLKSRGGAQGFLALSDLRKLVFFKLPTNEMNEINNYLDMVISKIEALINSVSMQIEKLKEYRQSIISEAVTGKIDVRDWQPSKKQVA